MQRIVSYAHTAAIEAAFACIPERFHLLLRADFFTGTDPVWAGLTHVEITDDTRSYRNTAHVLYPYHQLNLAAFLRKPTVVLPLVESIPDIVHELGHVLDGALGFRHLALPASVYARTNGGEAFAEAFAAWLLPGYASVPIDEATQRLFDTLEGTEQIRLSDADMIEAWYRRESQLMVEV